MCNETPFTVEKNLPPAGSNSGPQDATGAPLWSRNIHLTWNNVSDQVAVIMCMDCILNSVILVHVYIYMLRRNSEAQIRWMFIIPGIVFSKFLHNDLFCNPLMRAVLPRWFWLGSKHRFLWRMDRNYFRLSSNIGASRNLLLLQESLFGTR